MSVAYAHVCVTDKYGTCADLDRDWCIRCLACTVWNGEFCAVCGQEWGEEAGNA